MQHVLTASSSTSDWIEEAGLGEHVLLGCYVAPPSTFREYSGADVGEFWQGEIIMPGAPALVQDATHSRLLDEGIAAHRGLWKSLSAK
jgi:hypothetical protein